MTIHLYRLCGFAPREGHIRWSCTSCPRVVDQETRTGAIIVLHAGAESAIHGGRHGQHHIFDQPELGAFEAGPWREVLKGLEF